MNLIALSEKLLPFGVSGVSRDTQESAQRMSPFFVYRVNDLNLRFDLNDAEADIDAIKLLLDNWVDPAPPHWDGFAQWAMTDPELNAVFATAQTTAPLVAAALTTTLLQVQDGHLSNFAAAFSGVVTAGGATQAQRDLWANMARDTYHLPEDFVAVVRGSTE